MYKIDLNNKVHFFLNFFEKYITYYDIHIHMQTHMKIRESVLAFFTINMKLFPLSSIAEETLKKKKKEYYLYELVVFHVWICNYHLCGCVRNIVYFHLN